MTLLPSRLRGPVAALAPGVLACAALAAAANTLAGLSNGPVMLIALLLGMGIALLGHNDRIAAGVGFTGRQLLRLGVALLGARISLAEIAALGWPPLLLVLAAIVLTIGFSILAARLMRFHPLFGLLSGGATAICGASAALALSAALPGHPRKEYATLFTIVGVSILSTAAMVLYPLLARAAGLDDNHAGLLIGATIHDVAQVVGAGYAISPEAGDTATLVKLIRVAMLAPVIIAAGLAVRAGQEEGAPRAPLLPWFVTAFGALAIVNSLDVIPGAVTDAANHASRWCLVAAVAAIGVKTRLSDLASAGWKPALLMILETIFLAAIVLAAIKGGLL
jgi:uncharacterized integral membrane protein (TIGR00698 family)